MGAIQYLNSYYMGQHLQQEEDFVSKCMSHLDTAAEGLSPQTKRETATANEPKENPSKPEDDLSIPDGKEPEDEGEGQPAAVNMAESTNGSVGSIGSPKKAKSQTHLEHSTEEASLQCIQRALLLLKTHLDTFKRR